MTITVEVTAQAEELLEVQRAHDLRMFGALAHDADEIDEVLAVTDEVLLARADGRPAAFAARWPQGAEVVGDPGAPLGEVYPALLASLVARGCPEIQFPADDETLLDALADAGWAYAHSVHALSAPVGDVELAPPRWPDEIAVRDFEPGQARAVHRMIYTDAAWSEVVGHHDRTFEQWSTVFLDATRDDPVVAWRDDVPMGAALTRRRSSGEGHITQIAVSRAARGRGLGRALVIEAFRRLARHEDVTSLGLEVIATNAHALDLYLSLGLRQTHESMAFDAPNIVRGRSPAG